MVKLHPAINHFSSNNSSHHLPINDINLQIPLSNLYSHGYLSSSNQLSSFDDSYCNLDNSEIDISSTNDEEHINFNLLNDKLLSYHIYKYSRREHQLYYSRIKRTRIKKHLISPTLLTTKKSHSNESISSIFNQKNFLINIPTKINSRQRITSKKNSIYPLLFSPNFHTLVQLPTNNMLKNYFIDIEICFHLLHSIASQEFQIIVNNYDHQHEFSYTSLSFINILQQTMIDYTKNLHRTFKRNYFHLENHDDDDDNDDEHESNNELSIPPLKIRRYDDSSYEIEKRSTSSSSSGMSITQINNGHIYEDRRRCLETRSRKFPSRISDIQINSNSNDINDFTVGSPLQNE